MTKVIASDVRKGNVLEHEDGKLYVVMSHETFRPGKGTPTTTIVMRRIIDGVKTTAVFKTTDGLEKAFVEQIKHTFLFDDGDAGDLSGGRYRGLRNHVRPGPDRSAQR